jgi:hypothetical protein
MEKWSKIKIDKIILKNLVTFAMVLIAWTGTQYFYMIFLQTYGPDMKIYDVGVLAGITGGIWGYAMTRLSNFRTKVHKMDEKEFYAPSFYKRLLIVSSIFIVIMFIFSFVLREMLINTNL